MSKIWTLPPKNRLKNIAVSQTSAATKYVKKNSCILETTFKNFDVDAKVDKVNVGPVVSQYEIIPAPTVKVNKILGLKDNLSLELGGKSIRIEAPIPGKSAIGIEVPNDKIQTVYFKSVLEEIPLENSSLKLPAIIGKTVDGKPYVVDINKMPHLLIAGQTGSGKSVCINTLINSLLMSKDPSQLKFVLIDPKKVELSPYNDIQNLMFPVITEPKDAIKALQWATIEMERRYRLLRLANCRNIKVFNKEVGSKLKSLVEKDDNKILPFIVVIIDELADLMLTASKEVESLIQRIAQLARAVGIHLIVATQRPSVDVITGKIKANLTSRIAFKTAQSNDSMTIIGHTGAETLLGNGDMLFLENGAVGLKRYHGAFIDDDDIESIVSHIKTVNKKYKEKDIKYKTVEDMEVIDEDEVDPLFNDALKVLMEAGVPSIVLLQRKLKVSYDKALTLVDQMEQLDIIGYSLDNKWVFYMDFEEIKERFF